MAEGDPREVIEQHLLTTMQGITQAAGYDLPENFRLTSRELLMWDQTGGRYPAVIQQMEEADPQLIELGYTTLTRLPARIIVYFMANGAEVPAQTANRYRAAIERGLVQDSSRGGRAMATVLDTTPQPLIWRDMGGTTIFETTIRCTIVYLYDPKVPALTV